VPFPDDPTEPTSRMGSDIGITRNAGQHLHQA
jgi:hypothetical protein